MPHNSSLQDVYKTLLILSTYQLSPDFAWAGLPFTTIIFALQPLIAPEPMLYLQLAPEQTMFEPMKMAHHHNK